MPPQSAGFDDAKMHAFGERLVNDAASMILGNLAYIGDQLGLFKLLAQHSPVTPEQLAAAADCNARYIREWLSAMTAAGWPGQSAGPPRCEHTPGLRGRVRR